MTWWIYWMILTPWDNQSKKAENQLTMSTRKSTNWSSDQLNKKRKISENILTFKENYLFEFKVKEKFKKREWLY